MRKRVVAGNWKMNTSLHEALDLARGVRDRSDRFGDVECVLVPPFPWLVPVRDALAGSNISVGAQNCYSEPAGAFTGEVSASMLAEVCSHVIIGHSERRHVLGESDELVARKISAALETQLDVILCVGETLEERESGDAQTTVSRQLESAFRLVSEPQTSRIVVAYEPVWAIGTGKAATSDDAQEMASFVRFWIAGNFTDSVASGMRIQYGGSVKADNAGELMDLPDVDGVLVGGASLDAEEFSSIVASSSTTSN